MVKSKALRNRFGYAGAGCLPDAVTREFLMSSLSDLDPFMGHAIRALAMDAVQQANSGHPGAPMGMADIANDLWSRHLRHNPADPAWADRDRFVLSNGHGSMRSEEHTSELQSLMRISYAVFCLNKNNTS